MERQKWNGVFGYRRPQVLATPSTKIFATAHFIFATFSGHRADYAIGYDNAAHSFTVTDLRAAMPDGIDTVSGVELF